MEKIGLYGGTFGPPHLGHVYAAKTFLREVAPDRLLIMPAGIPPHKEKAAGDTPELRLAMCRAAFGDLPHTEISDYEIRKPGKSYTVETLEHLAAPGREITMLCGTDMFLTLDHWHRAPDISPSAPLRVWQGKTAWRRRSGKRRNDTGTPITRRPCF